MTSRQARTERRAAERKAAKLARKAALTTPDSPVSLEDEFSPELVAEAQAVRERIAGRASLLPPPGSGLAPQNALPPSAPPRVAAEPAHTRSETNRLNALHSTGPRTSQGKLASSRNSLKHGLASGELIIPGEDRAALEALLNALLEEHHPANTTEEMLIHQMAQSYWLTQRALRLQNDCFTAESIDEKRLALFLRYQTTHERAFHKALNTLVRLQKARRAFDNVNMDGCHIASGFVSQRRASTGSEPGFVSQNPAQTDGSSPYSSVECLEKDQLASQAA